MDKKIVKHQFKNKELVQCVRLTLTNVRKNDNGEVLLFGHQEGHRAYILQGQTQDVPNLAQRPENPAWK